MTKLLIQYLTNEKRHYAFPHFVNLINKSTIKNNWIVLVLTNGNDSEFYKKILEKTDIQYKIVDIEYHDNYIKKVHFSINYASENKIPFIMKCDNDIFFTGKTLDFMIQKLDLLNEPNNLTLGPILTSGIPTVEYFCEDFLDENAKNIMYNMFLNTKFYNIDDAYYENLNDITIHNSSKIWDKNVFFNKVNSINHYYKGIHPIRVNDEAINFLNNYIIKNKTQLINPKDEMSIITDNTSPYLCNSCFCIKTDIYKKIVEDRSLFVDSYEEVPLNKYCWKNSMNHLFVKNGFGIHIMYNWFNNHMEYEKEFCDLFFTDDLF